MVLYSLVIFFTLAGGAGAYQGWLVGHRPSEFFVDKYFWFVRVASLGSSALVLLCLYVVTGEPRLRRSRVSHLGSEHERPERKAN
jgi:hypothetical protein